MGKPNFDALVQEMVNAAVKEGEAAATFTKPMKPYYDATHAARDALMDAIDKATRGVTPTSAPQPTLRHNERLCADCTTENACQNRLDLPRPCWTASGVAPARTTQDYAIEHAEYLAQQAEAFLAATNARDAAYAVIEEIETDRTPTDDEREEYARTIEAQNEQALGLRECIYEFRKRRDRAATSGVALPRDDQPKGGA